jgi:hypothetical protein
VSTITFTFDAGRTDLKATRQRKSDGAYWNVTDGLFETFSLAHLADYDVPLTESPSETYSGSVAAASGYPETTDTLYARVGDLLPEDFDEEFPRWLDRHDNPAGDPEDAVENISPAQVIAALLVSNSLGSDADAEEVGAWPVFVANEPPEPDDTLTVFDSLGIMGPRFMASGRKTVKPGVQVRIRSREYADGFAKAAAVRTFLDSIKRTEIAVAGVTFLVHTVSVTTPVTFIGNDPDTRRPLFTVNSRLSLTLVED